MSIENLSIWSIDKKLQLSEWELRIEYDFRKKQLNFKLFRSWTFKTSIIGREWTISKQRKAKWDTFQQAGRDSRMGNPISPILLLR